MKQNEVKELSLRDCEERFPERFAKAIQDITAWDLNESKNPHGLPLSLVNALLNAKSLDTNVAATDLVKEWVAGGLNTLSRQEGPKRLAIIAELLARHHPKEVSCLVLSYANHLHEVIPERRCSSLADKIETDLLTNDFKNWKLYEWFMFAFLLHFKTRSGNAVGAFKEGSELWRKLREGFDVPFDAFYSVRRSLFMAKRQIVKDKNIANALNAIRDIVPFNDPIPDFERFPIFKEEPEDRLIKQRVYDSASSDFAAMEGDYMGKKRLYRSEFIDRKLRSDAVDKVVLSDICDPWELPEGTHEFAWLALLLALNNKDTDLFNGYKVRPVTRLTDSTFSTGNLEVQQTTYYESQVTNWSTGLIFEEKDKETEAIELKKGPYDHDLMSGHYGVMSLVITADKFLVAMYQSSMNMRGKKRLVPLGGSIEYFDFFSGKKADRKGVTLGAFLRKSMEREIREEIVIDKDSIREILILGHTLDSVKGLKPDFFGVAFIKEAWADIAKNQEPLYGGRLEQWPVNLDSPEEFLHDVLNADSVWKCVEPSPDAFLHANMFYLREAAQLVVDRFHSLDR